MENKVLDMGQLIGIPIRAICDANIDITNSVDRYIDTIGLSENGRVATKSFIYKRISTDEYQNDILEEIKLEVPLLSMLTVPSLQVEEADIEFCLEIKELKSISLNADERKDPNETELNQMIGHIAPFKNNLRETDNLPKCMIHLKATKAELTEGMSRVLDLLNTAIIPERLKVTAVDKNGLPLEMKPVEKTEDEKNLENKLKQYSDLLEQLQLDYLKIKEEFTNYLKIDLKENELDAFFKEEGYGIQSYLKEWENRSQLLYSKTYLVESHQLGHSLLNHIDHLTNLSKKLENTLREYRVNRIISDKLE